MENIITITAEPRTEMGKRTTKQLRKTGKIPAIIYGGKEETLTVAVNLSEINRILKSESGENSILRINYDKGAVDAMLKDIQYDYLSDYIIHADFIRINLDKAIDVEVPIILTGEAIGVKMEDGILDFVNRQVLVRCLPAKIPKEIKIEISELHSGHSIKVEQLPPIEGVQYVSNPNTVICAVVVKGKEEEVVKEVAAVEEVPEGAPEVTTESKEEKKPKEEKKEEKKEKKEKKEE